MKIDVLVLAGARNNGPLKEVAQTEHEALIRIGNIPMVEYVIRAVNKASSTGRVVVVGPRQELKDTLSEKVDYILDSGDSMMENILSGVKILQPAEYVLIITSDIPLITSEVIDDFLNTCLQDNQADIYYPIIPKENNKAKFPKVKRTYVHLAEGTFTGGNMVIMNPKIIHGAMELMEKAIIWRKKPWKLSHLLGMKFILKFVIGNLSIDEIEKRVAKITGYRGRGMITQHPEIGFDVDKPSDLELMRKKYIL